MTNEELVVRIQVGETDLMLTLWEQVKRYAYRSANRFYYLHSDRCAEMGVELTDLEQEAFIAIHKAVEKFKSEKGVKFLTYAEYRLKQRFHIVAKLHNGGDRYHESKFDDIVVGADDGCEGMSFSDSLADPHAAEAIDDIAEREYQQQYHAKLSEAVNGALNQLYDNQREAVVSCLGSGLSCSEYARQKGISRQRVHQLVKGAVEFLKTDWDFSNQLCALRGIA